MRPPLTTVEQAAHVAAAQDVLVAFAGWMAQQESRRRSERIKAGLDRRRAQRQAGWSAARRRRQEATKTQRLRRVLGEQTTPHRPPGQDSTTRSGRDDRRA
jgi:DNA invertase Pin-like site-specific DNA recombinase